VVEASVRGRAGGWARPIALRPEGGRDAVVTVVGLCWSDPFAGDAAGYHRGRLPRNKGLRYPPDPPTVDEIVAVMSAADETADGVRLRAVIVVLWRAGLRVSEALALRESDLDLQRGAVLVRHGKRARGRDVTRRGAARRHSAPARARKPGDHLGVPARDR